MPVSSTPPSPFRTKLDAYIALMRLNRPAGIWLLLWPTLWALWVASNGHPPWQLVAVFAAGVVIMRSAGCVINDYFDRGFDPHVARTRQRPLASGQVAPRTALVLFAGLGLLAAGLLLFLNASARWLAIPALLITILYPLMKRYTHLPQLVLGVAFAWGVPMAFAAVTGYVSAIGWWVFTIACVWPIAYDTMYAMTDRNDDMKIGVKSTAILLGRYDRLGIAVLHSLVLLLLILLGLQLQLSWPYYLSLGVAAGIMAYLQYLIRHRNPADCFHAFRISHWIGAVVLLGLLVNPVA
jgi:4-hydroxybenzoate polyprenyltransferase